MKKILTACFILMVTCALAQSQDSKTLHETGKTFTRQGDYSNAILVLNKAAQQEPSSLEIKKDLVFAYYLNREYDKALQSGTPLTDRDDADVHCYQLLGLIYKALEERKECEKLYKKGIKAFPNSGVLYNEYGEMLWSKQDFSAIRQWEKGIQVDPGYAGNYYNAAKYYYYTRDKVWGLVYGEIFVNLDSYSKRSSEIQNLLLEGYKKLFMDADMTKDQDMKNEFVKAYLDIMGHQSALVANGITPEVLTMVRTRFVLEWFQKYATQFPFRFFEYQQQLLKSGMFEAYNQWLFGAAQNLAAYQAWTNSHTEAYTQFNNFQRGRVLKLPAGQYYQSPNK